MTAGYVSNESSVYVTPEMTNVSSWLTTSLSNSSTTVDSSGLADYAWSPNIALVGFFFGMIVVTAFANLFVLLSFAYEKKLRTTFSILIGNLALTDFIIAVIPMNFNTLMALFGRWQFGNIMCYIYLVVDFCSVASSIFTLIAISIDRLWAITWSIHYRHNNTKKKAVISVALIWFFSVGLNLFQLITNEMFQTGCQFVVTERPPYMIVLTLIFSHLPCFILVTSYAIVCFSMRKLIRTRPNDKIKGTSTGLSSSLESTPGTVETTVGNISVQKVDDKNDKKENVGERRGKMYGNLEESSTSTTENIEEPSDTTSGTSSVQPSQTQRTLSAPPTGQNGRGNHNSNGRSDRASKTFVTLSYLVVAYVVCWQPFAVINNIGNIRQEIVPIKVYEALFWLTYVNSTLNPFLYAFSSSEVRKAFVKMIKCQFKMRK